jgi:hypothetical protein
MVRFSPQPEGTGRIFPIALSLVAKMFQHLPLLASRNRKKSAPVAAVLIVLTGPSYLLSAVSSQLKSILNRLFLRR